MTLTANVLRYGLLSELRETHANDENSCRGMEEQRLVSEGGHKIFAVDAHSQSHRYGVEEAGYGCE